MVMALPPKVTEAVAGGLFGGPVGGPCCGVVWADSAAAPRSRLVQIKRRFMESLSLGTNPDRKPQPRPNECRTGRLSKGRRRGKSRQNECVTPGANNRLSNQSPDSAGEVTADQYNNSYSYDAEGRLLSAGGGAYVYDGAGNRVKKTAGGNVTLYWPGVPRQNSI